MQVTVLPFDVRTFFPSLLTLLPDPHLERAAQRADDVSTQPNPNASPTQESCDPSLLLSTQWSPDGMEAEPAFSYSPDLCTMTGGPPPCRVCYQECDENNQGGHTPSEGDLNIVPDPEDTCGEIPERAIEQCGIDESTIDWSPEGLCGAHWHCAGRGFVCALVCTDISCESQESRCAFPSPSCYGLLEEANCASAQECAEADYTGNADPGAGVNQMQDHPPGDITQKGELPPEMVAPPVHELAAYPSLGSENVCWANVGQSVGWDGVEEPREVNVGNEKWGLFVSPSVAFKGKAAVLPLGGQVNLNARADVGFSAGAYVWGKEVSLINVRATGEIVSSCSVKFDRVVEVFEVAVDPGDEDSDIEQVNGICTEAMKNRSELGGALKQALYNAVLVKQYYEQYGATTALCEYTIDAYDPPLFSANCSTEQGRQDAVGFWLDAYQTAYDAVLLNEATIQSAQQTLATALPTQRLPVLDESRHFTAFHYEFTYPVGPATVTVEIELGGSWGASGGLQMHWVPSPGTELLASGDIRPTAEATAFAFAGVGIGPVSFGVSGELLLIGAQAPLVAEIALGQTALPDDRPHAYLDELNLLPAPDFPPTKYSWGGSFTVGARPELEILSGELDLEARVNMVFFKKRFVKKLADWDGHTFGQTYEFLSQPGGNPLGANAPNLGEWGEDVPYLDPASVSDLAPPTDPQVDTPELPNLVTVCSIII